MDKERKDVKPKVTPAAQARVEIAREKARMMGKKPAPVTSELEQAAERLEQSAESWAQKWKEGREFRSEQVTLPEQGDSPVSLAPVPLLRAMDKGRRTEDTIWRQHRLHPEERPRGIKMNSAMICTIAMHLRAHEWAKAMGTSRRRPKGAYDLEKEAEQWKRQKELERRFGPNPPQPRSSTP